MTLDEQLQLAIKDHLPSKVAGEMKAFIQQAESNKRELENAKKEKQNLSEGIVNRDKTLHIRDKTIATLNVEVDDWEKREADLITREATATKTEIFHELEMQKIKCAEAEKRADRLFDLTSIIYKFPKRTIRETNETPVVVGSYSSGYNNNTGESRWSKSSEYVQNETTTKITEISED